MDLSIIIPVYNTEINVFEKCISSISDGLKCSHEIVIVDDGSKSELSNKYRRCIDNRDNVRFFVKKNGGVSSARNFGLKKSRGEYVIFVDSDDLLITETIESKIFRSNDDVIVFDYYSENNGKKKYTCGLEGIDDGAVETRRIVEYMIESENFNQPWNKIYRRELLLANDIAFENEMINGEDAVFNLDVMDAASRVCYRKKAIYCYKFDSGHYEDRVRKRLKQILDDYLYKYEVKKSKIEKYNLDKKYLEKMENDAVTQAFRVAMISCSKEKNKVIKDYIKCFNMSFDNLRMTNRVKYLILEKELGLAICFFAGLRNAKTSMRRV